MDDTTYYFKKVNEQNVLIKQLTEFRIKFHKNHILSKEETNEFDEILNKLSGSCPHCGHITFGENHTCGTECKCEFCGVGGAIC